MAATAAETSGERSAIERVLLSGLDAVTGSVPGDLRLQSACGSDVRLSFSRHPFVQPGQSAPIQGPGGLRLQAQSCVVVDDGLVVVVLPQVHEPPAVEE